MSVKHNVLINAIHQALDKLSEQGPLEYFVHHNTLHHYQSLDFFEAIKKAAFDHQSDVLMSEEFYWKEYAQLRIKESDLYDEIQAYVLKHNLGLPKHILMHLLIQAEHRHNQPLDSTLSEIDLIRKQYAQKKDCFFLHQIQEHLGINIDYYIAPCVYKVKLRFLGRLSSATWCNHNHQFHA